MMIKVCGMRDPVNCEAISELDIDLMGFIFYQQSPRYTRKVPPIPNKIKKTGVFVNASQKEVMNKRERFQLDFLQLHGDEAPDYCRQLQQEGYKLIKAFRIDKLFDFSLTEQYKDYVQYFLFDAKGKQYGGNGITFNWDLLTRYYGNTPFFLSGGIDPKALEALLEFHHPKLAGIDLNSGFETVPGLKHKERLQYFLEQLKHSQNG